MKDLPHVFRGEVKQDNNLEMAYSKKEEKIENQEKKIYDKTINQKLKEIFNSNTYVYKQEVVIKTKTETLTKQLVGKNTDYLITLDNELIPLKDIIDIYIK